MKILIISTGFLGDGMLAGSFAENCKRNGYERVDLIVGWPQILQLLRNNPHIDNVFLSNPIGANPPTPKDISMYDRVYNTPHLVFSERPIDTFNKAIGLTDLEYNFKLYVPDIEIEPKTKPRLSFQYDWHLRSFGTNKTSRNPQRIIEAISSKYEVLVIGDDTHWNIDENTPITFLQHCAVIKNSDVFFGYPGGMHWVAAGTGVPTITTSEWLMKHYIDKGEYKGNDFNEFKDQWMVHACKNYKEPHILFEPEVSDDYIIEYLLKYEL